MRQEAKARQSRKGMPEMRRSAISETGKTRLKTLLALIGHPLRLRWQWVVDTSILLRFQSLHGADDPTTFPDLRHPAGRESQWCQGSGRQRFTDGFRSPPARSQGRARTSFSRAGRAGRVAYV
jgi:hypothetical protein